jgi:hypothetical protein
MGKQEVAALEGILYGEGKVAKKTIQAMAAALIEKGTTPAGLGDMSHVERVTQAANAAQTAYDQLVSQAPKGRGGRSTVKESKLNDIFQENLAMLVAPAAGPRRSAVLRLAHGLERVLVGEHGRCWPPRTERVQLLSIERVDVVRCHRRELHRLELGGGLLSVLRCKGFRGRGPRLTARRRRPSY